MTEIFQPGIHDGNQELQPVIKPDKRIEPSVQLPGKGGEESNPPPKRVIPWPH